MKVARWGNSLAVRLPVAVVDALELAERDVLEIHLSGKRELGIDRDNRRQRVLEWLPKFQIDFPSDYKFERDEASAR